MGRQVFETREFRMETTAQRVAPSIDRDVDEEEVVEYDLRTRPSRWSLKICFDLGIRAQSALAYFSWTSTDGGRYLNHVPLTPLLTHLEHRPPSTSGFMTRHDERRLLDPELFGVEVCDKAALSAIQKLAAPAQSGNSICLAQACRFKPGGSRPRRAPTMKFYIDSMAELEDEGRVNRNFFRVGTVLDEYGAQFQLWYQPHVEELKVVANSAQLESEAGGIVLNMPIHLKPQIVARLLQRASPAVPLIPNLLGSSYFPGTLLVVEPVAKWYWYTALTSKKNYGRGRPLQVYLYNPEMVIQNPTPQTVVIVTYAFIHKATADTAPFSFSLSSPGLGTHQDGRTTGTASASDLDHTGVSLFLVWFSRIILDDLHVKTQCAKQMQRAKYLRSTVRWALGTATDPSDVVPTLVACNNQQLSLLHATPSVLKQCPQRVVPQLCTWCVFWPASLPAGGGEGVEKIPCLLTKQGRKLYVDGAETMRGAWAQGSVELHYAYKQLAALVEEHNTETLKGQPVFVPVPGGEDCPICYEGMEPGNTVQLANCGHFMCGTCARRCVQRKISACCLCRTENPYPKAYRLLQGTRDCVGRVTNYRTTKFDWLEAWARAHPEKLAIVVCNGQLVKKALLSWGCVSGIPVWSADVKSLTGCRKLLGEIAGHCNGGHGNGGHEEGKGPLKRKRTGGTGEAAAQAPTSGSAGFVLISRCHQKTSLLFPQNPQLIVHFSPFWKKGLQCYNTVWTGSNTPTVVFATEDTVEEALVSGTQRSGQVLFSVLPHHDPVELGAQESGAQESRALETGALETGAQELGGLESGAFELEDTTAL